MRDKSQKTKDAIIIRYSNKINTSRYIKDEKGLDPEFRQMLEDKRNDYYSSENCIERTACGRGYIDPKLM